MSYTTKKVTLVIIEVDEIMLKGFWPMPSIEKILKRIKYRGKVSVFYYAMDYSNPHLNKTIEQYRFNYA